MTDSIDKLHSDEYSNTFFKICDQGVYAIGATSQKYEQKYTLEVFTPLWFSNLWYIIRASVPLLEFAIDELKKHDDCEFNINLRKYYQEHLLEESNHDKWLLDDLSSINITEKKLKATIPSSEIVAMVGSQYYLIQHEHPASLLGYIGLLEGYPASQKKIKKLISCNLPSNIWRTYILHAKEDVQHQKDLCNILDTVPEDNLVLKRLILSNALRSSNHYCHAIESQFAH